MRTQGIFYSGNGTVYVCELERCPRCNGPMRVAYTSKYKLFKDEGSNDDCATDEALRESQL